MCSMDESHNSLLKKQDVLWDCNWATSYQLEILSPNHGPRWSTTKTLPWRLILHNCTTSWPRSTFKLLSLHRTVMSRCNVVLAPNRHNTSISSLVPHNGLWHDFVWNNYLGRPRRLYPTTSCVCSACSSCPEHPAATTSSPPSTVTTASLRRSRRSLARSRRFRESPKCGRRPRGSPRSPDPPGSCQMTPLAAPPSESSAPTPTRCFPSLSGRILTSLSLSL